MGLKDGSASINCYVDENGRCRQKFELRGRFDDTEDVDDEVGSGDSGEDSENSLAKLILWFEQFEKPSSNNCTDVGQEDNLLEVTVEEVLNDLEDEDDETLTTVPTLLSDDDAISDNS